MADPGRRSRAWGVLAVSLALMALVTALSSATDHRRKPPSATGVEHSASRRHVTDRAPRQGSPESLGTHEADRTSAVGTGEDSLGGRVVYRETHTATVGGAGAAKPGRKGALDSGVTTRGSASTVFATPGTQVPAVRVVGAVSTGDTTAEDVQGTTVATSASTGAAPSETATSTSASTSAKTPASTTSTSTSARVAKGAKGASTGATTAKKVARTGTRTASTGARTPETARGTSAPRTASGSPAHAPAPAPRTTSHPTTATKPEPSTGADGTGTGSSAVTGSVVTGEYPGNGSIDPPATSASFAATGGGTVSAQATWTGTATLELEIVCPGGLSVGRAGSSGLSLEIDDSNGAGTCTVTLSLPQGVQADVSYTLVVEPAP